MKSEAAVMQAAAKTAMERHAFLEQQLKNQTERASAAAAEAGRNVSDLKDQLQRVMTDWERDQEAALQKLEQADRERAEKEQLLTALRARIEQLEADDKHLRDSLALIPMVIDDRGAAREELGSPSSERYHEGGASGDGGAIGDGGDRAASDPSAVAAGEADEADEAADAKAADSVEQISVT